MISPKENRPGVRTGAEEDQLAKRSTASVAHLPLTGDPAMIARAEALVVLVADRRGRYRRRVFLSLASAQRACEQAAARGVDAQIVLCQLTPIGGERL